MARWQSADGRHYDKPRFDGRLKIALVSDEVLDEHFDHEWPPSREDHEMPDHLARQLGWRIQQGRVRETMTFVADGLNETFQGFPIDSDSVARTLAEGAVKGTTAAELLDLVLAGPKSLKSADLPPEATRFNQLANHTRPLAEKALRSHLRRVFETWNRLDHAEVSNRLRPSYRPPTEQPAEKPSRDERRKDHEGVDFTPTRYR